MSRFLIDTDVSIDLIGRVPSIVAFVEGLSAEGISISVATYMEMYQGDLREHGTEAPAAALRDYLAIIPGLSVTLEVAARCAEIRADLQRRGRSVRPRALDLLIAATAIEHGLTLVTRNVSDYGDVPGLSLLTPPET